MAIHIGHARAGMPGLIVAGASFILPAVLIVTAIAWAYVRYRTLPVAGAILYGVQPVIIAVVLQALWGLGRTAVKTRPLAVIGIASLILNFAGGNELIVLFGAGALACLWHWITRTAEPAKVARSFLFGSPFAFFQAVATPAASFGLWPLFLFFLKVGSVLFGSGYVLLAFLRADLVDRWHWLSNAQLLDAVAVGQVTPGPVFTTATFIGYVLGGAGGAAVATIGIFLPAFVFVAISGPLIPRIRRSPTAGAFLDGVNAASIALMAVVTFLLGRAALVDIPTILLALTSAFLLIRFRLNSAWLIAGGAVVGMLLHTV